MGRHRSGGCRPCPCHRCVPADRRWFPEELARHVDFRDVALAVTIVLTYDAMNRAQVGRSTASLSPLFDPAIFDTNSTGLALATLVLVALCVLNHVVFLRREFK